METILSFTFSFNFWTETFGSVWDAWSVTRHVLMLRASCSRWLTKFSVLAVWILLFSQIRVWIWIALILLSSILLCSSTIGVALVTIIYFIYMCARSLFQVISWVIFKQLSVVLLLILTLLFAILVLSQRILLSCSARNCYSFELWRQNGWDVLLTLILNYVLLNSVVLAFKFTTRWNFQ